MWISLRCCRYYYAMVEDPRGDLVEALVQLLFILLDYTPPADIVRSMQLRQQAQAAAVSGEGAEEEGAEVNRITPSWGVHRTRDYGAWHGEPVL